MTLVPGHELDLLVGEKVFGWTWIQAPQWDAKGPLPQQGMVLIPPGLEPGKPHGYQWPNVGVIAAHAFTRLWSRDEEDALQVVRHLVAHRCRVNIHIHPEEGATVQVVPLDPLLPCPKAGKADALPLAVCLAALAWAEVRGAAR